MKETAGRSLASRFRFYLLASFIVLVFLIGGGSRDDIYSLVVLRPLAALVLGIGLMTLSAEDVWVWRHWLILAGITLLLPLLHVVPLPPLVWQALPGREVIADIDAAAGLESVWRPISMAPARTWNAVFALLVPLAVLVVGLQLTSYQRRLLLRVVIGIGVSSAILGLLQAIGSGSDLLYFYRITNFDSAVGLFSNRNHQALLLAMLLPLLAAWAMQPNQTPLQLRTRSSIAVGLSIILLPMVLVTGSRAGLALTMINIVAVVLLQRTTQITSRGREQPGRMDWRLPLGIATVLLLGTITVLASRAEAIHRLANGSITEDLRFEVFGVIWDLVALYGPVGSGIGTFVEVYQLHEPDALLQPQYLNHAHNDLLELLLTAGIPGLLLLVWWLYHLGRASLRVWRNRMSGDATLRSSLLYGRASSICIATVLLASLVDYPLRTPSIMAAFVVFCLWLADGARSYDDLNKSASRRTTLGDIKPT